MERGDGQESEGMVFVLAQRITSDHDMKSISFVSLQIRSL